jgi:ATP-dependent Clp protease protease subunit
MRLFLIISMFLCSLTFAKEIVLTEDNTLVLDDAFTGSSVAKVIQTAREMDADLKSGYPIYLFLNTPGGSIQAGLELIEALNGLNRPVHTITLFAASMGWQLLQHMQKRYVLSYGILMSHKARGRISGEFGGGLSQLDARYGLWLKRIDLMDKKTVQRTKGKKTLKQYRSDYDNELWLNGMDAVKEGYADEVVTVKCSRGLEGERISTVNFMGMRFRIRVSKCPIVTSPLGMAAEVRTNRGYMEVEEFLSEGGKFGKNCRKEDQKDIIDSFSEKVIREGREAELCALDEALTFEKIQTKKKEINRSMMKQKTPINMTFFGE